jgi:hypothetical protein
MVMGWGRKVLRGALVVNFWVSLAALWMTWKILNATMRTTAEFLAMRQREQHLALFWGNHAQGRTRGSVQNTLRRRGRPGAQPPLIRAAASRPRIVIAQDMEELDTVGH